MGLREWNKDGSRILDTLPINTIFINQKAIVTYTNEEFTNTFGKGYMKSLEKGPGDLLSCANSLLTVEGCGHSPACGKCILRQFLSDIISEKAESNRKEIQITTTGIFGEEKRWFEVKAIPILMEKEKQFLITFTDVSVYKMDQYDLVQHKKLADAANKAKSEFLANMSHEIRTPLNGVIGMLEMTLLTELTEEQQENVEVARNCADTLLNLINNILDLSKVESNKVILEDEIFDIRELLQKVMDTQTAKVLEKNLHLEYRIDDKIPALFCGDAFRLQQVLLNLVSNAVKFTEQGSIQVEVKNLCRFEDIYTVAFSVEDTGIGISQRELNRLFKPFSQVDGAITRKYGGTGLGLAISQGLINLMGGEIKVKSGKGKGSVFFFTIQMKTSKSNVKKDEKAVFEWRKENLSKILLVEDDRYNQIVVKQMLNKIGYQNIEVASNGFEALKKVEQIDYDAILMDIQLPEMDGIDTTNIIREREKKRKKKVPIIAVTAHALKGDREKFLKKGMDEYVTKPIDANLLNAALEKVLVQKGNVKEEVDLKEVYAFWHPESEKEKQIKEITLMDKSMILLHLGKIQDLLKEDPKKIDDYMQIEKTAHIMKIMAQREEYDAIKTSSFRMELAARKRDEKGIQVAMEQLQEIIKDEKGEGT